MLHFNIHKERYRDGSPGPKHPKLKHLSNALGCIPGLRVVGMNSDESSGWWVLFECKDMADLFFITRCVDRRYFNHKVRIELSVGDTKRGDFWPTTYSLDLLTKNEDRAVKKIDDLIDNMNLHLNHKNFLDAFGQDVSHFDTVEVEDPKLEEFFSKGCGCKTAVAVGTLAKRVTQKFLKIGL